MKKYLLSGLSLFLVFGAFAQESSIVQVSTTGTDVNQAAMYYYGHLTKKLDALILENKLHVYKDEDLKQEMSLDTFKKETLLSAMWQIINPQNPDDPFDLIDTVISANQAVVTAESLTWKKKCIEFKTKNISGPAMYYLEIKEVEKNYKQRGYVLLHTFSQQFGSVNNASLNANADKFLNNLCSAFFTAPSDIYENGNLTRKMDQSTLNRQITFKRGERDPETIQYYPSTADAISGFVMGYLSDSEEDEIEFNYFSFAPTYKLSANNNPWYWISTDQAQDHFSAVQWICIQVIQSYTLRKRLNPYFKYIE